MEEKERYKWSQDVIVECPYEDYDYIVDTENNIIFSDDNYFKLVDLLNQQDKENQQLKQRLNDLPKKIVEEIRNRFLATCQIEKGCDTASFSLEVLNRILDQIQD